MVRASLHYVNWKERKRVAADLKMMAACFTCPDRASSAAPADG